MDPGKSDEGPSLPKKSNEEKASTEFELPFRVNLTGNKLNLVKPVEKRVVDITYPTVCFKEETAGNDHAFYIMFNIKHDNILSMELVCENKLSSDKNSVATFVEPYDSLWPLKLRDFADEIGHIPSPKFQSYLRKIIMGLDHLRMYDLYHGNLRWDSTLKHGDTIKLAGFRSQELKSKTEAQWGDWISLLGMLEVILDLVRNDLEAHTYFCGHLISLINMMKTLNRESLPTIKDTVLEQMFFWDKRRRLKFFSYTVSLKLKDANFMKRVAKSGIREKGWDKDCTPLFKRLVKKANDYHEAQRENTRKDEKGKSSEDKDKNGDYNGDSLADYVRLICGGCTHHRKLELDVDTIIRENHPAILSDIKEILEAPDDQDSPGHQSRGASQHQNIPGPSRGHMERQSRPSRGHMERQSPYSSRGASQHQNIPGPSSVPSQHPSYGSRGAPQHQNIPGPSSVPPSYGFYYEQQSEPSYSQRPIYGQSPALENYAMLPRQYYAQPPMAPEGGYQQQPHPYAGLGQWPVRGAPYPYPQHYPAYYPPVGQADYPYQAGYDAPQVGQAQYPPAGLGYPQQYPYRYGSTAPAAGQAAPAVRQPPYGQSGTQPPTNRPRPS